MNPNPEIRRVCPRRLPPIRSSGATSRRRRMQSAGANGRDPRSGRSPRKSNRPGVGSHVARDFTVLFHRNGRQGRGATRFALHRGQAPLRTVAVAIRFDPVHHGLTNRLGASLVNWYGPNGDDWRPLPRLDVQPTRHTREWTGPKPHRSRHRYHR